MAVWVLEIETDALVLGSRQELTDQKLVDARAAGVEVVPRRSGGGAVYLSAMTSLWIDLWFPTPTARGPVDLSTLFVGVGEGWARGLERLGLSPDVRRAPGSQDPARKALSKRVCFGDVGWGEVTVLGSKVVGLAQRRVREGCRVQCVAELSGNGRRVLDFVETTAPEHDVVEGFTAAVSDRSARVVAASLLESLLAL